MALDTNIRGLSGTQADVDSNNNLGVQLPLITEAPGFAALAGRIDDGTVVSGGRTNRVYVTEGQSLKAAIGTLLWDDTFNATAQNTSKYKVGFTTQTMAASGGFLIINNSGITTANSNSGIQTFKNFPLFAKSELRCNTSAMITVAPQTNCTTEIGLYNCALPGTAAPTDGVFFRWNTNAELRGVISYAGTETQTAAITSPSINVNHDFLIVVQTNTVTFWIDDILVGKITLLTDAPGLGQPFSAASVPWTARQYIGATPPSLSSQLKISDVFITYLGPDLNRPWPHTKAGFGHMGYQGQNGGTMGSTSNITNSQTLTAAVPTNTASLVTGLGGLAAVTLTAAANLDGIIFSYQNPAGSTIITPRNLIITGVNVGCVCSVLPTTTPWTTGVYIAYGHTAVSLATAESASFTSATTKAPRRVGIGAFGLRITALGSIGDVCPPITVTLQSPIVVAPGEFVALVFHNQTVPAAGAAVVSCLFDSHFE
jgi:hypothetical protein